VTSNLYVDITSGKLVSSTGSTQAVSPSFFFGDTLTLNVTFLQETGVVGNPLASVSFSGATVELGIGTLGSGPAVTASAWADNGNVTGSISVVTTGSTTASAVQTLAFSSVPQAGTFALTKAATSGTFTTSPTAVVFTASANHGLVVGQPITLSWSGQELPAFSTTVPYSGTYVVYSTPTPTTFTVANSGGNSSISSASSLGIWSDATANLTATVIGLASNTFTTSTAHGFSVDDQVSFSQGGIFTGITAGATYYVQSVPTTTSFTIAGTSGGAQLTGISAASFSGSFTTPAQTTSLISMPVANTDIQSALTALSTIGSGNVLVSGTSPTFTISFVNALSNVAMSALSLSSTISTVPSKSATLSVTGSTLRSLVNGGAALTLEIATVSGGNKTTLCQTPVSILSTLFT
jgi:hypothetical protein